MVYISKFFLFLLLTLLIPSAPIMLYVPTELTYSIGKEEGSIEVIASIFLFFACMASLIVYWKNSSSAWGVYALFMFAAAAREMDWHKEFTSMSIFKSRFYLNDTTPIPEKIFGLIIVLILVYGVIHSFKLIPALYKEFISRTLSVNLGVIAFLFIVIGKTLDGLFRYFPALKIYRPEYGYQFRLIEEGLEFFAAFLFCVVPLLAFQQLNKK